MHVTALSGVGGVARCLRGLTTHLARTSDLADTTLTVIGNTGDDITLFGLRVCPDLDTLLYTLGGGVHEGQGWGRADDTAAVQTELAALGVQPQWFGLGDRDLGTHIARSLWLGQGHTLSEVTARLADRWGLPDGGITLLPMTDTPVETHVVVDEGEGPRAVHFPVSYTHLDVYKRQSWCWRPPGPRRQRGSRRQGRDESSPVPRCRRSRRCLLYTSRCV